MVQSSQKYTGGPEIRSTQTEAEQTWYKSSQSTEPEKAEFHTRAIPNMVRDCVKENSLENIHQTMSK